MNKYWFTALVEPGERKGFTVTFPDLPGCITEGDDYDEAMANAREALELHIYGMEQEGMEIPKPTPIPFIEHKPTGAAFVIVEAWMAPVRDEMANRAIKKTLTIPSWLNEEAEKQKLNFSQVLQEALKRKLGVPERGPGE